MMAANLYESQTLIFRLSLDISRGERGVSSSFGVIGGEDDCSSSSSSL